MDGINSKAIYLGRREKDFYLFKEVNTGNVLEIHDDVLFGKSILSAGNECVVRQVRTNCYIVS